MLSDLTTLQRALYDLMSDLSEEAYCAGWLHNLDYYLWQAVIGIRDFHNQRLADEGEIVRLKELSRLCGGWIVFDDVTEKTWLPLETWEQRFEEWSRGQVSPEGRTR